MKPFFDFFGESPVGVWLRESQVWFPLFEMLHLAALAVLLGSIVLLNARFFGVGLRRESVAEVAEDGRADDLLREAQHQPALELRQEHHHQQRHEEHAHQRQRVREVHGQRHSSVGGVTSPHP